MADLSDTIKTTKNCPSLERLREGPPTVSVDTAAEYLGVSRGFAYSMVKTGHLPVIRVSDKRMRVSTKRLLQMLEGEGDTAATDQGGAA
jgi:excisionase family DNA binding protein